MTAPALRLVQGGGERAATAVCAVCSVAHGGPCGILRRHVEHLRMRGLAETTIANRRAQVRLLSLALPVPVLDATAADLMAWRTGMRREPGGVCNAVSHVTQFYAWAVADGLIRSNPAAGLPVPRRRRRLPRPIGQPSLFAALDGAPQPIRVWIVLGAWCGLRCIEIAGLRGESVRLDDRTLIVTAESTKGGRRERLIPLTAFTAAELAAWGIPGSGYVFRSAAGGPLRPHRVSHLANDYLRSAGIADEFHSLRHFFGTASYRGTHDLLAVADLMGHADVSTTSLYAKFDSPQAVAAVESIPLPPRPGAS